jgi:hypothetical protein
MGATLLRQNNTWTFLHKSAQWGRKGTAKKHPDAQTQMGKQSVIFAYSRTRATQGTINQMCTTFCYTCVKYTNCILNHFYAQEKLSDSFRQASAKIGATIGLRVNEEDGTITPVPPVQIEIPEVHGNITKSQSTWTSKILHEYQRNCTVGIIMSHVLITMLQLPHAGLHKL